MKQFEYLDLDEDDANLNQLGLEGWELVSVVPASLPYDNGSGVSRYRDGFKFYFKREIKQADWLEQQGF